MKVRKTGIGALANAIGQAARAAAEGAVRSGDRIDVQSPANVIVAGNIGEPDSTTVVTSRSSGSIRQGAPQRSRKQRAKENALMTKAKQKSQTRSKQPQSNKPLSPAEIDGQQVSELPEREAMSLVNANLAVPINIAAALNVLSDGSVAGAIAEQDTPIDQST